MTTGRQAFAPRPSSRLERPAPGRNRSARTAKQVADLGAAGLILAAASPLFALIALLVRLSSPGPVFFRQRRAGRSGRPFRIWKFRTMVVGAARTGHVTSLSDPRVTRIGRILRLTSLDELPQLFNVLAGEMSLVGPRALLPESIRPEEAWRLSVKPGVTSLPIVRGRQSLDWAQRMELDAWYVENWSLFLDLRIVLETLVVVALRKNVYDHAGRMRERQ